MSRDYTARDVTRYSATPRYRVRFGVDLTTPFPERVMNDLLGFVDSIEEYTIRVHDDKVVIGSSDDICISITPVRDSEGFVIGAEFEFEVQLESERAYSTDDLIDRCRDACEEDPVGVLIFFPEKDYHGRLEFIEPSNIFATETVLD